MRVGRGGYKVLTVRIVQAAHETAQLLRTAPDPTRATGRFLAELGTALSPTAPPTLPSPGLSGRPATPIDVRSLPAKRS
jgi:hypothetical protein